ncbi:MAG TPA: DUF3822 family protein [Chitinophagaceae bacterium]|nr:DUF3822 family protein [Chitinophagaceae bacterium]
MKQLFTIENSHNDNVQQVLSLKFGNGHFSFVITNKAGDELYKLAYCKTEEWNSGNLHELLSFFPELKNQFYRIQVCYDFEQSTLVSLTDFRQEESGTMLKALYGVNTESVVITEAIPEWQLYNVYSAPAELRQWLQQHFASALFRHQFSFAFKQMDGRGNGGSLYVDFRTDDFSVTAMRSSKLLLAQTYVYSTPEDVVYYLLKICSQFGLSQQEAEFHLSGLIDKQSALYKEIYQYFIHVDFREATWNVQGDEYPNHFFTSLNDLARCVS